MAPSRPKCTQPDLEPIPHRPHTDPSSTPSRPKPSTPLGPPVRRNAPCTKCSVAKRTHLWSLSCSCTAQPNSCMTAISSATPRTQRCTRPLRRAPPDRRRSRGAPHPTPAPPPDMTRHGLDLESTLGPFGPVPVWRGTYVGLSPVRGPLGGQPWGPLGALGPLWPLASVFGASLAFCGGASFPASLGLLGPLVAATSGSFWVWASLRPPWASHARFDPRVRPKVEARRMPLTVRREVAPDCLEKRWFQFRHEGKVPGPTERAEAGSTLGWSDTSFWQSPAGAAWRPLGVGIPSISKIAKWLIGPLLGPLRCPLGLFRASSRAFSGPP